MGSVNKLLFQTSYFTWDSIIWFSIMAGVGLRAGGDIIETFLKAGPKLMIAGSLILLVD